MKADTNRMPHGTTTTLDGNEAQTKISKNSNEWCEWVRGTKCDTYRLSLFPHSPFAPQVMHCESVCKKDSFTHKTFQFISGRRLFGIITRFKYSNHEKS